ncbi:hypothetical protein TcasGA2_TC031607 [Tribolium castaneum]|uniref:Uncharacterized protein n=1 Tax=Tribolium castaneum TaxID=7070 RepID=A0A139WAG0_TRICA|nr:hypothetical protein TcasGA2_TC031607 [Tribolium castaneum]
MRTRQDVLASEIGGEHVKSESETIHRHSDRRCISTKSTTHSIIRNNYVQPQRGKFFQHTVKNIFLSFHKAHYVLLTMRVPFVCKE